MEQESITWQTVRTTLLAIVAFVATLAWTLIKMSPHIVWFLIKLSFQIWLMALAAVVAVFVVLD